MLVKAKQIDIDDLKNSLPASGTTVALVAEFSLTDGELIVKHLSSMTPSIVDGEFIVELETL